MVSKRLNLQEQVLHTLSNIMDFGLGQTEGLAELALDATKFLVLNALTFGGYGTYSLGKALWDGYKEQGVVGALNAINQLHHIARHAADAAMAIERGDYRAAGNAEVKGAAMALATVATVAQGVGAPGPGTGGGGANIVYRGLAAGENPAAGLVARAPQATNSIASHVAGAQASQWISTTRSFEIDTTRFGKHGVVIIDLSKVPGTVVDLTGGIPGLPPTTMLSRWAIKMQEVVIQHRIPAEAIKPWP